MSSLCKLNLHAAQILFPHKQHFKTYTYSGEDGRKAEQPNQMRFPCSAVETQQACCMLCHLQSGRSAMNSLFRRAASREWRLMQLKSLKQHRIYHIVSLGMNLHF